MLFSETEWPPLLDRNLSSAWFQHEGKCAAFPGDPPERRTAQLVCISCPRHWLINLLQVHLPACTSSNSAAVALHHQCVWEPFETVNHWVYVDVFRSTSFVTEIEFEVGMSRSFVAELYYYLGIMFFVFDTMCTFFCGWGSFCVSLLSLLACVCVCVCVCCVQIHIW